MKIAILSDIHGNNTALKAVLMEIDKIGVDKILFLGDYVGYYYSPDIIFNLMSSAIVSLCFKPSMMVLVFGLLTIIVISIFSIFMTVITILFPIFMLSP